MNCIFLFVAEANIDAICQAGLDPKRRAGQAYGAGEYFATNAATSLAYCKGGRKMLVFAVLTDVSGLTTHTGQGYLRNKQGGAAAVAAGAVGAAQMAMAGAAGKNKDLKSQYIESQITIVLHSTILLDLCPPLVQ